MSVTEQQARMAAEWWAQKLQGGRQYKTTDFVPMTHSMLSRDMARGERYDDDFWDNPAQYITRQQYEDFVAILTEAIQQLPEQQTHDGTMRFKEIGVEGARQLPEIVRYAALRAGIEEVATLLLPSYMFVIDNGQMDVNGTIISPPGAPKPINLYKLDPSQAPYVVDKAEPDKVWRVIELTEPSTMHSGISLKQYAKGDWLLLGENGKGKTFTAQEAAEQHKEFFLTLPDGTKLSDETYYPGKLLPALGAMTGKAGRAGDSELPPRG